MSRLLVPLSLLLLLASTASAVPAPGYTWRTLRTGCCDIHYHEEAEHPARRVAAMVDEIVAVLSQHLDTEPSERVHIIIADVTDSPNGYAMVTPYNRLVLYAAAPDSEHELARTDDWLRMLLTHEMLHILHLDTIHGLPRLVNAIIGKQWPPNGTLPSWAIEGMATYAETAFTGAGRLRSARWRGYLHLAALEGDLWSLDDALNNSRRYPAGNASRLYGGHFLWWLAEAKGDDTFLARFNHDYASRLIPYAMQRSLDESAGVDLSRAWAAFLDDVRKEADERLALVRARGGPTTTRRLTRLGGSLQAPRFVDERTLLFASNPPTGPAGAFVLDDVLDGTLAPRPLAEVGGDAAPAPLADGSFVVSMTDLWWSYWTFRDLFRFTAEGTPERLSHGARYRSPAAFPDGKRVVVEARTGARSSLVLLETDTGEERALLSFDDGTLAYTPEPSPDGRRVVFAKVELGGVRGIVEVDVESGEESVLVRDAAENVEPTYTPDGRHVIFASDRDGALNLYAVERASRRVLRVTDVLGSASQPVVTPDGRAVVFVGQTLEGDDLFVAALDLELAPEAPAGPTAAAVWAPPPATQLEDAGYNPLGTLRPYKWMPTLDRDALGGLSLGVVVDGSDAVELHRWALQASYGFALERPSLAGSWSLRNFFMPVTLNGSWRTNVTRVQNPEVPEPQLQVAQVARVGVSTTLPLRRWLRSHRFTLGYARDYYLVEEPALGLPDAPIRLPPAPADIGWLTTGWTYSDTDRYRDSVSPERGYELTVRARVANEVTLSALDLYELTTDLRAFQSVPGLPGHALAVYLSGGVALGDRRRRTSFRLGGFAERDLTRDVVDRYRYGAGYLRGYPFASDVGDAFALGTLEYRFPIWEVERGVSSLPLWVSRVHGAVFGDLGDAFDGIPRPGQLRAGVGGELRLAIVLGYYGYFLVRAGYAKGLMPGGVDQPYLVMGVPY